MATCTSRAISIGANVDRLTDRFSVIPRASDAENFIVMILGDVVVTKARIPVAQNRQPVRMIDVMDQPTTIDLNELQAFNGLSALPVADLDGFSIR